MPDTRTSTASRGHHLFPLHVMVAGSLALCASCSDDSGREMGTGIGSISVTAGSADGASADDGMETEGDEQGEGEGEGGDDHPGGIPNFDVSYDSWGGMGTGGEETCKKVDLLFVIDNSGSMFDNQINLINSFPGFVDAMREELSDVLSYHVGVVTSDAYPYNSAGCTQMGALVTQTGGSDALGQVCTPFVEGGRYMTEQDDLNTKFACVAQVGTGGNNDEHQAEGSISAIQPAINGAGGCNDGFIREDALLVVVYITDEDDGANCGDPLNCRVGSPGVPEDWFPQLVDIKGGIEQNMVVVSLLWGMAGNVCPVPQSSEHIGAEIQRLTEMFTYGFLGDVCAPDYAPILKDAISLIDSACSGFTPPG